MPDDVSKQAAEVGVTILTPTYAITDDSAPMRAARRAARARKSIEPKHHDLRPDPRRLSGRLDLAGRGRVLRAAGHRVLAPTLDGCAERRHQLRPGITTETQAEEIAALLFYEDLRDVVLVGTSSGGMVLCRAAELARERIGRVVFADALALFNGETVGDIVTTAPPRSPPRCRPARRAEDAAGGCSPP